LASRTVWPVNPAGCLADRPAGRVGEHDLLGPGEPEELAEHRQPVLAALGQGGQERFDVVHAGQRPVAFAEIAVHEPAEVADGCQRGLDRLVCPGPGACPQGAFPGPEHERRERFGGRAQRPGDGVDAAPAPSGGEPFVLVGRQRQAPGGEQALQRPGEGTHRTPGAAGTFQDGLRVVRVLVFQQPPQHGDHGAGAGGAVPGREMGDEIAQPVRRVRQPGGEVRALDERAVRVTLPAR
jgi:hypothetical protein